MYRIVAVEDDAMMQQALRAMVVREGFEFICYGNGGTALQNIVSDRPDLVLLDVHLPDMSGHEICRMLKTGSATRSVPIIMLTGEAREIESRVSGLDAGADDYLFKPISPKLLMARIQAILKVAARRPNPS